MSDESNKAGNPQQNKPTRLSDINAENVNQVDFENLSIKLLCVVKNAKRFEGVSGYLIRRGWELEVTESVRDALKIAATYKPDFVLISMNANNKNIAQLPQIVMRTFSLETIIFGENSESKTIQLLQTAVANHKIMGFVSGPMLQRKMKQIVRNIYKLDGNSEQNDVSVEGQGPHWGGNAYPDGDSDTQKKPDVMIFEKDKSVSEKQGRYDHVKGTLSSDSVTHGSSMGFDGENAVKNDSSRSGASYVEGSDQVSNPSEGKEKHKNFAQEAVDRQAELEEALRELRQNISDGTQNDQETNGQETSGADLEKKSGIIITEGADAVGGNQTTNNLEANIGGGNNGSGNISGAEEGQDGQVGRGGTKKSKVPIMESAYFRRKSTKDGKLVTPVERQGAIEKIVRAAATVVCGEHFDKEPVLDIVSELAVLPISHKTASGYLLLAGANIGEPLSDFARRLYLEIKKNAAAMKQHIETSEIFLMNVDEYGFFENDESGLEFNHIHSLREGEFAVKFINDADAWPEVQKDEKVEKSAIRVEQIEEDLELDFDVFIYLRLNKKFYRLIGQGSALTEDRKARLVEKKTQAYINPEDTPVYRQFKARNIISRMILAQAMKRKKAAG